MKQNIFKAVVIILLGVALVVGGILLFRSLGNNGEEPSDDSTGEPPSSGDTGVEPPPPSEPPHIHSFVESRVEDAYLASAATCLSPATYYYLCSCGEVGTDTYGDGDIGYHTMLNGICTVCHRSESSGLIFTPNPYDEEDPNAIRTCTLSGFGSCTDVDFVIPSLSPDGMTVTHIGAFAFENNGIIECVTIPTTVKEIAESAFKNSSVLRTVRFVEESALTKIGVEAFANCDELEAIVLPDGLTRLGKEAFFDCNNLRYITLPTTLETVAENAFARSLSLNELALTEGVKTVGNNAFGYCDYLSSIDLPDTLETINEYAFAHASIKEVEIPASVREIHRNAFFGCNELTEITVHADNPIYYSINGALYRKSDNALIIYPHANKAESLEIPDGMTTIPAGTFTDHQRLINVSIPASVTKIEEDAFFGCSQLETVTFPENSELTEIGKRAFSHCKSLKSINIPDGITEIGLGAFESCTGLASVTIPYGVTTIHSYAFSGCESLESIEIPDTVTHIDAWAFKWTGLKSVTIPRYVSACEGAFIECQQLASVKVAEGNLYYKVVDDVLYSKDGKRLIVYPGGKQDKTFAVPFGVESVANFAYCRALESVYIPSSVTALGDFGNCTSLKTVTFAENCEFTGLNSNFLGCTALTEIVLPKSVTHISYKTFADCSNLISVTIPDSVTEIGDYAFSNCQALSSIIFKGSVAQWNAITFADSWDEYTGEYTVHCIDGDIAKDSAT